MRDNLGPSVTLRDNLRPRVAFRDNLGPRATFRDNLRPRVTLRDRLRPKVTFRDSLRARVTFKDNLRPRVTFRNINREPFMTSFYYPKDDYDNNQYQYSAISWKNSIFYIIKIDLRVRNPSQASKPLIYSVRISDGARRDASNASIVNDNLS